MFHSLNSLVGEAAFDRIVLLLNHVIEAEPVAVRRLQPHAGRVLQIHVDGWPAVLPAVPPLRFRITPVGLLEACDASSIGEPALSVHITADNPALALAQALTGQRPRIEVAGDAALAADLQWLIDNLRWDVEDDLARIVGPAPARQIARLADTVASGLRQATRTLSGLAARR